MKQEQKIKNYSLNVSNFSIKNKVISGVVTEVESDSLVLNMGTKLITESNINKVMIVNKNSNNPENIWLEIQTQQYGNIQCSFINGFLSECFKN